MATARSNKRGRAALKTTGTPALPGAKILLSGAYGGLAIMWLVTEGIQAALGCWPAAAFVVWLLAGAVVFAGMVLVLGWWQERQR
jgi:hypothetical protein